MTDASADLPQHWPGPVRDTYETVVGEQPDIAGASHSSLVEACELLTAAYRLDEVAAAAGYVSTGSTGQVVAHPCTVEARLNRTAAASILARLVAPTSKGQRLARARHGGVTR